MATGSFRERLVARVSALRGEWYKPEKHYMRGPGPATLRKQESLSLERMLETGSNMEPPEMA